MIKNKLCKIIIYMLVMNIFLVIVLNTISAEQDGDYTYTINNGFATITKYTGTAAVITIPSTLGGYSTIAIGDNAFNGFTFLTSVTIPHSIITIGNKAFKSCVSLTTMVIPDNVTTIGNEAFYYCSDLTTLILGNKVNTIGNEAFSYCSSITNVTIPDSVVTIGDGAFYSCSSLTNLAIPDKVVTIGNKAFEKCSKLKSITIGNNVRTIGNSAFASCSTFTTIIIPNNVTSIGEYAFSSCSSLTSVTIGIKVKNIGSSTFAYCSALTSITFLGLIAPTLVGHDWILNTPVEIRGHAYASSNFPAPGETWHDFHGLKMGTVIKVENILPLAGFSWTPTNVTANQTITCDASTSNDPDGALILYEWDWNNDGVYDESNTTSTATHSWTQSGDHQVTLRVTDNDNKTNTKTIIISVSSIKETNNKGTPGFEFIFILGAIFVSIVLWKNKKHK